MAILIPLGVECYVSKLKQGRDAQLTHHSFRSDRKHTRILAGLEISIRTNLSMSNTRLAQDRGVGVLSCSTSIHPPSSIEHHPSRKILGASQPLEVQRRRSEGLR